MRNALFLSLTLFGLMAIAAGQSLAADARSVVQDKQSRPEARSAGDAAAGTACGCTTPRSGGEKKVGDGRSSVVCPVYVYIEMGNLLVILRHTAKPDDAFLRQPGFLRRSAESALGQLQR